MKNSHDHTETDCPECSVDRRGLFSGALLGMTALGLAAGASAPAGAATLTAAARDALTPNDVIAMMLAGNARFISVTFIGMIIGSLLAGFMGDRFGRRFNFQFNLALFGLAWAPVRRWDGLKGGAAE